MANDKNDGTPRREPPLAAAARRLAEQRAREEAEAAAGAAPAAPRWQPAAAAAPAPEPNPAPPAPPAPTLPAPTPPTWAAAAAAAPTPPAPAPTPAAWAAAAYPPPPQPASYASGGSYSAWWKRVLAALLDGVIISIPVGILGAMLGAEATQTDLITGQASFHPNSAYWTVVLLSWVISLSYYAFLEGGAGGASVGKMALNIQVRDATDGGPIGYGRAFARRLVAGLLWWLLVIPGLIDVLSPLWDSRRQTLHDKAVSTVVVDKG